MTENTNDNEALRPARTGPSDAHGQAAMLLVESLIHALIARSVISVRDAVEIVELASEVEEDMAEDRGDNTATMQKSLDLLASVRRSLSFDLDD